MIDKKANPESKTKVKTSPPPTTEMPDWITFECLIISIWDGKCYQSSHVACTPVGCFLQKLPRETRHQRYSCLLPSGQKHNTLMTLDYCIQLHFSRVTFIGDFLKKFSYFVFKQHYVDRKQTMILIKGSVKGALENK